MSITDRPAQHNGQRSAQAENGLGMTLAGFHLGTCYRAGHRQDAEGAGN